MFKEMFLESKPNEGERVRFKHKGYQWSGVIKSKDKNDYIIHDIIPKSDWKRMVGKNEVKISDFQIY